MTKNSLPLVTWKPKCIQEGFTIYKSSRIFHNLIDRDKCWTFLVKAFDLGYEKSSIVIPFVLGVYTYSRNGRDCCRPNNFCHIHRTPLNAGQYNIKLSNAG